MPDRSRVPKAQVKFDKYIKRAVNILLATSGISMIPNWQMLGLTSAEMDKIQAFLLQWWSGNPDAPGAYELHTNAYDVSKNEVTRKNVLKIIKAFSAYFSPLLIRIEGSPNITSEIRLMLNIAEPNPPHTKHTAEIIDSCFVKVIATQGEKVLFECSSESNAGRASMLKDEGEIKIEVLLSLIAPTIDDAGKIIPPLSPTGTNDPSLKINEYSTKASFYLTTIPEGSTYKTLQGYARWADIHNPERKGPWTPIPPTIIN